MSPMLKDLPRALGVGLLLALMTHLPDHLAAMDLSTPTPPPGLSESVQKAD
jgi:hypothetical protein